MDQDQVKELINTFSFDQCKQGSQGFSRILIQMFGLLGHGKSSFINTCIYVWKDGEYQNWAKADEQHGGHFGGHTTERIPHKLTDHITLVDNRGLPVIDGYETGEIFAQLGNLLPLGRAVEWNKGFTLIDRIVKSEKLVKYSDFIVPVFVHSLKNIIPAEVMAELKNVLHTAKDLTGIYPIVVLTHKTSGNLTSVESIFRDMGIERIFSFENYTREDHFKTRGRHEEVLKFLQEVIRDARFRVEHQTRDPIKEMQDRKKFLMEYVHQREMKKEKENQEKKKALEQAKKAREFKKKEEELQQESLWRKKEEEEEIRRKEEEFRRQRLAEQAKREEEIQNLQESKTKGNKKRFSDIFRKKK